ncbi:MAG TPA: hypothetical protein VGB49_00900 [Caulobacteraceae bacterium]|jgi:streptogramin lyase
MNRLASRRPLPAHAVLLALLALSAGPAPAQDAPPAPAAASPFETLASTNDEPILVESVAFDTRGRLLVGAVHRGGVWRLDDNGRLRRFSPEDAVNGGVFGMAADRERGDLWVVVSNTPYDAVPGSGSQVLRLDLNRGTLKGVYGAPAGEHVFGDIAVAADGVVYVSDTASHEVLRLTPGSGAAFEPVINLGERGSPQGIVTSDTGALLLVVDYPTGLHRVVTATGSSRLVAAPEGVNLRGLDGLARVGNRIIAVQNGTATPRILGLTLSADWTRIEAVETLAEGGNLSEPTTGTIAGGGYVFVSRSQWTDFNRDGTPKSQTPQPAVVSRLRLR